MQTMEKEEKPRKIKNSIKRRLRKIAAGDRRAAKRWSDISQYKSERRVRLAALVKTEPVETQESEVLYKEKPQDVRNWNSFSEWEDRDK